MTGHELLSVLLRALVYAGSIGVAGTALFAVSFPRAALAIKPLLQRLILAGFALLLVAEPLRYLTFQLSIAGGDWSLAFGPDLISMGFETPLGQAAAIRLIAGALVAGLALRSPPAGLLAALCMIAAFLLEGHTASGEPRIALAALLLVHLAAAHWWLGALLPLLALTRRAEPAMVVSVVETFGARALWVVTALLLAGALLALLLTGGVVRLESAYQQRLLAKLLLVAAMLSIAAWNKLRLTPLLRRDYAAGASRLCASIRVEIAAALALLAATAWLVGTAPDA
jgi:putative copper resistance protein D